MSVREFIKSKVWGKEAAAGPTIKLGATMQARPVVALNVPYGFHDRLITPEITAADRNVHIVLSAIVGLNRMCFYGFDHVIRPVDASDDTQGPRIAKVLAEIQRQEKRLGRVGKSRNVGTLGLIRAAALDGWTHRQAFNEYTAIREGNWTNFGDINHLQAQSFSTAPMTFGTDMIQDAMLPGVVFDSAQDRTRYY